MVTAHSKVLRNTERVDCARYWERQRQQASPPTAQPTTSSLRQHRFPAARHSERRAGSAFPPTWRLPSNVHTYRGSNP